MSDTSEHLENRPPAGYRKSDARRVLVTMKVLPSQMLQYPAWATLHQVKPCTDVHGHQRWHEATVSIHPADEHLVVVLPKWFKP